MSALAAGERKGPVELKRCSRTVTPYGAFTALRARLASAPRDTGGGQGQVQGGRRPVGRRMRAVSASAPPRRPGTAVAGVVETRRRYACRTRCGCGQKSASGPIGS